jgi:hypothetical protein
VVEAEPDEGDLPEQLVVSPARYWSRPSSGSGANGVTPAAQATASTGADPLVQGRDRRRVGEVDVLAAAAGAR